MQKKVSISFLAAILFFSFTFVGMGNAKVIKPVPDDGIKEMANELEYIFTEILIKNETTGFYDVNHTELNNSNYTDIEKNALIAFAVTPFNGVHMANEFTRCLAEALDITQSTANKLIAYIDAGDYYGVASVLGAVGIMVNPVVVFVFAMTCGQIRAS